jgi:Icc-related predicted phosphoesterase
MKIALMSDLHGHRPNVDDLECDLLLISGDITIDKYKGQWQRHNPGVLADEYMIERFKPWLQPHIDVGRIKDVVYTWGNHDWTQGHTMTDLGPRFHCLVDREVTLCGLRIWGSPWSNTFLKWDWMGTPEQLAPMYAAIPDNVDIILSHTPPYRYGDPAGLDVTTGQMLHPGSKELLAAIERIRPALVVCGHFHSGYGTYTHDGAPLTQIVNATNVDEQYQLMRNYTLIEI